MGTKSNITEIHLASSASIRIGPHSVETTGFRYAKKKYPDYDEIEGRVHDSRVDGMELTLLALISAKVIDRNDPRLKAVLEFIFETVG